MMWLRSTLFLAAQIIITPLCFFAMLLSMPFGHRPLYALIKAWTGTVIFLARVLCGIEYRVWGRENIPDEPTIVLSKHQSAWETFFFLHLFPTQVWLLKRELLRVPFFGWGLAMLKPIAIDRSARFSALKQLVSEGRDRLAKGLWIIIFPEGTRTRPGESTAYAPGGALLAAQAKAKVLPVALNSGEFWSKDGFLKRPGVITVSIGPAIDSRGMKPEQLNEKVRDWIENEMNRLAAGAADRGTSTAFHRSSGHEAGEPLS
jgi:1-acyl-sn-glycerol-3-phosphate acyltransferase